MNSPEPLRVVYRYHAGNNDKQRPSYFSKSLALASFLRAIEPVRGVSQVLWLVDGPLPGDVERVMAAHGDIVRGCFGSNRQSYLHAVQVPRQQKWDTGLVWFSEDDYLYAADAFTQLLRAARHAPALSWFAMYGPTVSSQLESPRAQGPVRLKAVDAAVSDFAIDDTHWGRIDSTTSTFGGWAQAVRADERILRLCPWSGAAWDRTTCLAVQGVTPYPWRHVLAELVVPSTPRRSRHLRATLKIGMRLLVNLRAQRRTSNQRLLFGPTPNLATHMEVPYLEPSQHWDSAVLDVIEWAAAALPELALARPVTR